MKSFNMLLVLFASICIINANRFLSPADLPKTLVGGGTSTGYIAVNETADANLFYMFFQSRSNPATDPLVLWMTGGPGCSGELAVFFENGPFTVNARGDLLPNPYSWNNIANVIYIDQPVGVGFSYANSDYVNGEKLVADDVYAFLQGWMAIYPEFAKNPFYVIGESYGGHYVPSVGAKIVEENENSDNIHINLVGVAIGNGLVSPIDQDQSYGVFGYKYGLINESVYEMINETYAECKSELEAGNYSAAEDTCEMLMPMVLEGRAINYYDIKLPCNPPPLCYDFSNITDYLNDAGTKADLGVTKNITWETCNFVVNSHFGIDIQESYADDVGTLLDGGYQVLVYSGMLDLICNYIGGDMWTSALEWSNQDNFNAQDFQDWMFEGEVAGHVKHYGQFTFLEVEGAGHMVPHDQPARALALLSNFLSNQTFTN